MSDIRDIIIGVIIVGTLFLSLYGTYYLFFEYFDHDNPFIKNSGWDIYVRMLAAVALWGTFWGVVLKIGEYVYLRHFNSKK